MQITLDEARELLQQYALHLAALGLCILAGAALGAAQIGMSAGVPEQSESWALPAPNRTVTAPLAEDDLATSFWSEQPRQPKKKAEVAKAAPTSPWTFLGTVAQGEDMVAVIIIENTKIRHLGVGDSLPDGSIISAISHGSITLEVQGAAKMLRLFAEKKSE